MKTPDAVDEDVVAPLPATVRETLSFFWESPFPATLQDAEFRLVDVNEAYLEFTGYPRENLIGRDPIDLQPPEDHANTLDRRSRLQATAGRDLSRSLSEGRFIDAGGFERWFSVARRVLVDEKGAPLYLAVLQDTTNEHAARDRADRSVREIDDWFDLSPVGMVLFDDSGLLVRTNVAFDEMAGSVPVSLAEASPSLAELLAWGEGGALTTLRPGSRPIESLGWARNPAARFAACARSCAAIARRAASVATWASSKTAAWRKSATSRRCRSAP